MAYQLTNDDRALARQIAMQQLAQQSQAPAQQVPQQPKGAGGLGGLALDLLPFGRVAEKALTGRAGDISAGEVGLETALTLLPFGLGKIGKAAKGAKAASNAADAAKAPLKTSMAGKLSASADDALASQYGVLSDPMIREANPAGTVRKLADLGIFKPKDAERMANGITGSDGQLTKIVARAVDDAGDGVDTSTLRRVFEDAMDNYGIVDKDRKSLTKMFDAQMNRLSGGARGSINPKANANDAMDVMRSFEKRIADLEGKGGNYRRANPERGDMSDALRLVRDEIEDQIYVGGGANANLKNYLTPELRNSLVALDPKNTKWISHVDNNIMKATDVGTLRSAQAPFVNASKMIREGKNNAFSARGQSIGSVRDMATNAAVNAVKNPVARTYAKAADAIGNPRGLVDSVVNSRLGQAAQRPLVGQAVVRAPGALLNYSDGASTMLPGVGQEEEEDQYGAGYQDPSMGQGDAQQATNPLGYSSDELAQGLMKALAAGDTASAQQLNQMYELAMQYEQSAGGGTQKLNSAQATAAAKAANGEAALTDIEALYEQAGGGQGLIGGTLKNIAGSTNLSSEAGAYNDQLAATARMIARAMGETGAGSDADAKAYISRLPQLTDSPERAKIKLDALRRQLKAAQQNLLLYGGGADPVATTEY